LVLDASAKLFKFASEVRRLARIMSTSRELRDIPSVLHLVQWPGLPQKAQRFYAHRFRLLYSASKKARPANLHLHNMASSTTSTSGPSSATVLNHAPRWPPKPSSEARPPLVGASNRPENRHPNLGLLICLLLQNE
jgi:hypothetical protein